MNRMIKILVFTNPAEETFNAADLNAREIFSRFDAALFQIYFLQESRKKRIHPLLRGRCIRVILANNHRLSSIRRHYYSFLYPFDFHMFIRSFTSFGYWAKRQVFRCKAKTIHVIENKVPYPAGLNYNRTAAINAMKSDYVFGLTYTNISAAQRLYFRDDIRKTRVGVDLDVFSQKSSYELSVKPKIVCVGTLQNRKRPSIFIDLASEFPHLDFLWYGDGEQRNILEERIARSGLSNCEFIESQPHELLSQRLREADVFYLPSLHEGFGKASIEAMACGVPTIIHGDYNPEHIDSGKDGFVVRSDVEAKKRILELVGSKDLRKRISRNGRKKAELYSWEEIAKEWMEFFVREKESCKRRTM